MLFIKIVLTCTTFRKMYLCCPILTLLKFGFMYEIHLDILLEFLYWVLKLNLLNIKLSDIYRNV